MKSAACSVFDCLLRLLRGGHRARRVQQPVGTDSDAMSDDFLAITKGGGRLGFINLTSGVTFHGSDTPRRATRRGGYGSHRRAATDT